MPVCIKAARLLGGDDIKATVVNMRFIRPLDTELLDSIYMKGMPVITVEENALAGGFGSSVLEYYNGVGRIPRLTMIGIPDTFVNHAERSRLLSNFGLDAESIAGKVKEVIGK